MADAQGLAGHSETVQEMVWRLGKFKTRRIDNERLSVARDLVQAGHDIGTISDGDELMTARISVNMDAPYACRAA